VDVQSLETGIDSRDEHLLDEDYFDAANFQKIKLESSSIQSLNNGSYKVVAKLTIKNVTKSIEIVGFLSEDRYGSKFTTEFEINRRDYDVGGSSFSLSKSVQVTVIHYLKP
jgi:polyisoprenoid-binding protein YceI